MSFGITVTSSGGEIIFDSRNKKYYTLVGKMVSRRVPHDNTVLYINPPTIFNPTNSIFVVKPPQGLNSGGRLAWIGALPPWRGYYSGVFKLRFATVDGTGYSADYPNIDVYVYTTLAIGASSDFGLEVRDGSGNVTFNTTKNSHTLQITEQINSSGPLQGRINTKPADGVIISASFYQVRAAGSGYASPDVQAFRSDGSNIYGAVYSQRMPEAVQGGLSFTRTSVALVRLPDWDPPIINW